MRGGLGGYDNHANQRHDKIAASAEHGFSRTRRIGDRVGGRGIDQLGSSEETQVAWVGSRVQREKSVAARERVESDRPAIWVFQKESAEEFRI